MDKAASTGYMAPQIWPHTGSLMGNADEPDFEALKIGHSIVEESLNGDFREMDHTEAVPPRELKADYSLAAVPVNVV